VVAHPKVAVGDITASRHHFFLIDDEELSVISESHHPKLPQFSDVKVSQLDTMRGQFIVVETVETWFYSIGIIIEHDPDFDAFIRLCDKGLKHQSSRPIRVEHEVFHLYRFLGPTDHLEYIFQGCAIIIE
jgi:hypothetical protein